MPEPLACRRKGEGAYRQIWRSPPPRTPEAEKTKCPIVDCANPSRLTLLSPGITHLPHAGLRGDGGGAALPEWVDGVIADAPIAGLVLDQLLVESVKLDARVGLGGERRVERRRTHDHRVLKRTRGSLRLGVHAMPNRATLH